MTFAELVADLRLNADDFLDGAEKAIDKIEMMGKVAVRAGGVLTAALSGPLTGLGIMAFKAGTEFDEAFDAIRIGTGATGEALVGLQDSFKNVFKNVPNSANEVSAAITDLHQRLGLTGEPLEKLSKQFLDLATLTKSKVGPIIRESARLFNDWSVDVDKQSSTLDTLFKVSQATGIGVTTLTSTLVRFGAPLRQMGFDLETSAAMLGKFEKEGVNTGLVLASLRIALTRMSKEGVKDNAEALKKLVGEIKDAGTAGEANAKAIKTFGARAGPDMAAAIREGRLELEKLLDTLNKSPETIARAAEETFNFAEKFGKLKNHVSIALEPLGTAFLGILEKLIDNSGPVIDFLSSMAHLFSNLGPITQAVIIGIGALLAALGPLVVALGGATQFLAPLIAALGGPAGLIALLPSAASLALAFGIAIAGWAIYTAVTEVNRLNNELERLEEAMNRGVKATASQTDEIRILESAVASHNKVIGAQKIIVDSTGLTIEQYIVKLREAVKGTKDFVSSVKLFGEALAAANVHDTSLDLANLEEKTKRLQEAVKLAELIYKELFRRFVEGKISAEVLSVAQEKLRKAQEALDPERVAKRFEKGQEDMTRHYDELYKFFLETTEKLKHLDEELAQSRHNLATVFFKTANEIAAAVKNQVDITTPLFDKQIGKIVEWSDSLGAYVETIIEKTGRIPAAIEKAIKSTTELNEAFKTLGIESTESLEKQAQEANKAYEKIRTSGRATAYDILRAEKEALDAHIRARRAAGEAITDEERRRLKDINKELEKHAKDQATIWEKLSNQVSTVFTDLGRGIAELTFKGGKFKDVMVGIFIEMGKAVERFVIEYLMGKLFKALLDLTDNLLPKLGKVLGNIFGVAGSGTGGAPGGVFQGASAGGTIFSATGGGAQAAGSAGGAASSAGGIVGAGVQGVMGLVTGAISAVTGVMGAFQMHGMNKSLDIIVNHTLRAANQLISLQETANRYWPNLDSLSFLGTIHKDLFAMLTEGIPVRIIGNSSAAAQAGATGGVTLQNIVQGNVYGQGGIQQVGDDLMRHLKSKGMRFSSVS